MEGVCANTSTCVDCPEDGVADFTFSSNTPPLKDTNNKIVFFKGNDSTNDTANEPTFDSSTEGFSFDASTEKLTVTYDTALVLSNEFNIYSWVKCTDTSAKGAVFEKKA